MTSNLDIVIFSATKASALTCYMATLWSNAEEWFDSFEIVIELHIHEKSTASRFEAMSKSHSSTLCLLIVLRSSQQWWPYALSRTSQPLSSSHLDFVVEITISWVGFRACFIFIAKNRAAVLPVLAQARTAISSEKVRSLVKLKF